MLSNLLMIGVGPYRFVDLGMAFFASGIFSLQGLTLLRGCMGSPLRVRHVLIGMKGAMDSLADRSGHDAQANICHSRSICC